MKRYLFNGSFNKSEVVENFEGYETVRVVFLNDGKLEFGLHNIIKKLISDKINPTEFGLDFIVLGMMVYLADTKISRESESQNSWTREFSLLVPVLDEEKWNNTNDTISRMLNFLTGDKWQISFKPRDFKLSDIIELNQETNTEIDTISLFSGGMDSLISTINFLEQRKKILLVSHSGDVYTTNVQNKILNSMREKYSDNIINQLYWYLIFDNNIVPETSSENSTRSRSFLFICMGILALTGLDKVKTLNVPENGYIAMNVPLDCLRLGSLSTKTTHPFYMSMWNQLLSNLDIDKKIVNEYILYTKGEMAENCLNKEYLRDIIPISISCSAPSKHRWSGVKSMHCGHCVPCIIRRAAMYKAFKDDTETEYYQKDIRGALKNTSSKKGINFRSFQLAIDKATNNPSITNKLIYKSGPIHNIEFAKQLAQMYKRGLNEVDALIKSYCEVD